MTSARLVLAAVERLSADEFDEMCETHGGKIDQKKSWLPWVTRIRFADGSEIVSHLGGVEPATNGVSDDDE